ncbi:group II intron reverse transcriptase/maturase [Bacillus altitudinis]|uniref:group II intron reverse transcriptase/maturase n=1 Tax=Bacillus altitudinis TaxID=293387 RepID=UPI0009E306F0|nr:group II intron reverse transcriptase/maturase [Bacillus altitudinis]
MSTEGNIRLAYRNIKRNNGSNTPGTDGLTIKDIENLSIEEVVSKIQSMFQWYTPSSVRRVFIPKPNGDKRPLGIPTIWDRIFQQCILQVLEPIMEVKFHNHSYGFRPNRSTHHALARMKNLINVAGFSQCIDIDIKGFFDNVNHSKLLKQLWTLGIRDRKLLSIISATLRSEIEGEGIPTKGTPQGGIISPILSNVVLNELDWWVSDQWETFNTTRRKYVNQNKARTALKRNTKLKEVYIIRYADDFKILCRTRSTANRMFHAVKNFLKERLQLEISPGKSKIINLKRRNSEFLGLSIRSMKRGKTKYGYVAQSKITDKAKRTIHSKLKTCIRTIQKNPSAETVRNFNTTVLGIQNYYCRATNVMTDLLEIHLWVHRSLYNRLGKHRAKATWADYSKTMRERYKGYNFGKYKIEGTAFFPVYAQRHKPPLGLNQSICDYTEEGRRLIHNKLKIRKEIISQVIHSYVSNQSIEYNDNRISKFIAQYGKCSISKVELGKGEWECHHIKPKSLGGSDRYDNLTIIHKDIHKALHAKDKEKIKNYLEPFQNSMGRKGLAKFTELKELIEASSVV